MLAQDETSPEPVDGAKKLRVRSPEKAGMSDGDAQLFPDACRRHDRSGAVFPSETAVDVCGNFGIR